MGFLSAGCSDIDVLFPRAASHGHSSGSNDSRPVQATHHFAAGSMFDAISVLIQLACSNCSASSSEVLATRRLATCFCSEHEARHCAWE